MKRPAVANLLYALALALAATLSLLSSGQGWAQATAEQTVDSLYRDYMVCGRSVSGSWMRELVNTQKRHLDPELAGLLVEIAGNTPDSGKAWLDFDPFACSQMGIRRYVIRPASREGNRVVVPVALQVGRDTGSPKVRVLVQLEQREGRWVIVDFHYPAEAGMDAWDLKTSLKAKLQQ